MNAGVTGISEKLTLSLGGDTVRDLKCSSLRYFGSKKGASGCEILLEGRPMMRCETCFHEFTAFDFVTLRNLCEHVYLDSLAQKQHPALPGSAKPFHDLTAFQTGSPWEGKHSESTGELVSLEE